MSLSITLTELDATIARLTRNLVGIQDETGEFLLRLEDGRIIDTKGWAGWEWTHGIGLYGLYRHYEQTGDPATLEIILGWFRDRFAEGETTRNINTVSPFLTLAWLHERSPQPDWAVRLDSWAEWLMDGIPRTEEGGFQHIVYNSENHQQLWDDTLMMSVLPLTKIGLVLDRPRYIEEAKRQFLVHIKHLYDRRSGLWFHGWTFDGRHNFADALWARGNCWVTMAIPEFIELLELPEGDALRDYLIQTLEAQLDALEKRQDRTGLWRTLIPDDTSYLEASATAGFAYGILKASRLGYVDHRHEAMALRAIEGVLAHISADGELTQVSFGTPVFSTLQQYKDIPLTSMPYGQSMAILALGEYRRRLT